MSDFALCCRHRHEVQEDNLVTSEIAPQFLAYRGPKYDDMSGFRDRHHSDNRNLHHEGDSLACTAWLGLIETLNPRWADSRPTFDCKQEKPPLPVSLSH